MGRRPTGSISARDSTIRAQFQWQGQRVSETLHGLSALNPRDLRTADKMLADIISRIQSGTFDYAATFPDSKRASVVTTGIRTVAQAFDAYNARVKSTKSLRTAQQYLNAGNEWRQHLGDDTQLNRLLPSRVSEIAYTDRTWTSAKRFNNALISLRGALATARADNPQLPDWCAGIENQQDDSDGDPNPLSGTELRAVLDYVRKNMDPRCWAWCAFAIATGLRPSEQCVLIYSDIVDNRVHVKRARDLDGTVKNTKTKGSNRQVTLALLALEAVDVMKAYTKSTIFQNPWSRRPWAGSRSQHENVWGPTFAALGITARRGYCSRHTYATQMLAAGARVAQVSAQMGHTSPSMVEKKYAKWLPADDGGAVSRAFA